MSLAAPRPSRGLRRLLTMASLLRLASCLAPSTFVARQNRVVAAAARAFAISTHQPVHQRHNRHQHRNSGSASSARAYRSRPLHSASGSNGYDRNGLWYPPELMEHMIHRIRACNNVPYNLGLLDFTVNGRAVGKVTPKVAERLCSSGSAFELSTGTNKPTLTLSNSAGSTVEQRTRSVASVMEKLRDEGYIPGWRDELYPVAESFESPPLFLVERAAAPVLGILEYGVHVNGLVEIDGETRMWMARRSKTKSKFPGMLDHIVAGGQPAGLSLTDNVIKECGEEAGIPPELAKLTQPAGAISYESYGGPHKSQGEGWVSRVVLFCFDLTLPEDFVPTAEDGEVESFFTWGLEEIGRSMDPACHDPIKPNCYLVIIDYLLRSGGISPDSPGYLEVLRTLRSGTCA